VKSLASEEASYIDAISYVNAFPIRLLSHNRFDNLSKIESVHVPVFIAVGMNDDLTPPAMVQALFQKAKRTQTPVPRPWSRAQRHDKCRRSAAIRPTKRVLANASLMKSPSLENC
jgi:pimeloyl-ACP methyl ester carboxylesterase